MVMDPRLDLLARAQRVGESLDVGVTAQQLVDLFVPDRAVLAAVNLAEEVFWGGEPPLRGSQDVGLRRAAVASAGIDAKPPYIQPGETMPPVPDLPIRADFRRGGIMRVHNRATLAEALQHDGALLDRLAPEGGDEFLAIPLTARGVTLGTLVAWRAAGDGPYGADDELLLRDIAGRGALAIDNARRYVRERNADLRLQRGLLPVVTETPAVRAAGRYLAAGADGRAGGVGGDWFDVIPLSGARVALVVGDVVGHGQFAAAMMGQLRTAVQTLASRDPRPDELLADLDEVVARIAAGTEAPVVGSTCLYVIYDPVAGLCTAAAAGHPPPILVDPHGAARLASITPGPVLGVGGHPFEVSAWPIEPDSILALYTDGLIDHPDYPDLDAGTNALLSRLTDIPHGEDLETVASRITGDTAPVRDDITALAARLLPIPTNATAAWDLPAADEAAATARDLTSQKLTEWELTDLTFTTELVVSELVTNAVRYAAPPIQLRLIRNNTLICEVSDNSSAVPRLQRARDTDEGGRGLFIIAQLTERWGSRHTNGGKTIWAEIPSPA